MTTKKNEIGRVTKNPAASRLGVGGRVIWYFDEFIIVAKLWGMI
jgi:hypothetical protein